jgi:uncharacterized protein (TIGR03067 family)
MLQGNWQCVEIDGKKAVGVQAGVKISIKGDQITIWDFVTPDEPATLRLDPTKKPTQFDVLCATKDKENRQVLGIYELDGDTFKLRQGSTHPSVRPKDFQAKGEPVLTIKRLKE